MDRGTQSIDVLFDASALSAMLRSGKWYLVAEHVRQNNFRLIFAPDVLSEIFAGEDREAVIGKQWNGPAALTQRNQTGASKRAATFKIQSFAERRPARSPPLSRRPLAAAWRRRFCDGIAERWSGSDHGQGMRG